MTHVWIVEWRQVDDDRWYPRMDAVYWTREDARIAMQCRKSELRGTVIKYRVAKYERREP